jgi:hypothetical protein
MSPAKESHVSREPAVTAPEDHLAFLKRTLVSIKKEAAAGTPVDPKLLEDLESRISNLEKNQ